MASETLTTTAGGPPSFNNPAHQQPRGTQHLERLKDWTSGQAGFLGLVGTGAVISILVNGQRELEGVETLFAILVTVSLGAAIASLIRVTSTPSPVSIRRREAASITILGTDERGRHSGANDGALSEATSDEDGVRNATAEIGRQDIADGFRKYGDTNESSSRLFLLGAFVADLPELDRRELEMQFARAVFRGGDVALETRQKPSWLGRANRRHERDGLPVLAAADELRELLELVRTAGDATKSVRDAQQGARPERPPDET